MELGHLVRFITKKVFNFLREIPEEGTDVTKHTGLVEDQILKEFVICVLIWSHKLTTFFYLSSL